MGLSYKEAPVLLVAGVGLILGGGYLNYSALQRKGDAVAVEGYMAQSEWIPAAQAQDGDPGYRLEYRYTYEGQQYVDDTVCPGAGSGCFSDSRKLVENHPASQNVTVYVDKADPSKSFLIHNSGLFGTGIQLGYAVMVGAGLLLLSVVGYDLVAALRGD